MTWNFTLGKVSETHVSEKTLTIKYLDSGEALRFSKVTDTSKHLSTDDRNVPAQERNRTEIRFGFSLVHTLLG